MTETTNLDRWVLGQGRYEVKRKLGEGGMAFALLALDKTLGTDVVLKVPKPLMLADPEFARRFRREIRSMQELTHDHIVKIKDVGDHEGMPFYVMDLLAGGSLQDRFEIGADKKIKPLPPDSLADWLEPVAGALDFIHQRFVHRDIKPANILFDAYGHAFVSDFGIVKAISDGTNDTKQTVMTQAGMVIGTVSYMAPELSEGKNIDGRADQYALAATVYQVLSGRVPFEGTSFIEIIRQQLTGKIPPLHELVPTLPKSLTQVIEKGLSLDPKDRYASCSALAKAVLATMKAIPATSGPRASKIKAALKAVCPACRKPFALPPDPAGKSVKCPECKAGFTVAKRSAKFTTAGPKAKSDTAPSPKDNLSGLPVASFAGLLVSSTQTSTVRKEQGGRKPADGAGENEEGPILALAYHLGAALRKVRSVPLLTIIFGASPPLWLQAIWKFYMIVSLGASTVALWNIADRDSARSLAWVNAFQYSIGLLLVSITSVAMLFEERVSGRLDALLATPLSTSQIVWDKWLVGFRVVILVMLLPVLLGIVVYLYHGTPTGLGNLFLLIYLMLAYGVLLNSLGLALGIWVLRFRIAMGMAVTIPILLSAGPVLLVIQNGSELGLLCLSPWSGVLVSTHDLVITDPFFNLVRWKIFCILTYIAAAAALLYATQLASDRFRSAPLERGARP